MHPSAAVVAGLAAGLAIAMQFGAVSALLLERSIAGGPRLGIAGGLGVATADLGFATVAAIAGGAVGSALSAHEAGIRLVAGVALAGIALAGLVTLLRAGPQAARERSPDLHTRGTARSYYCRFLAITSANPLTIASFAVIAAALSFGGPLSAAAFVAGVGVASAAWHSVLAGAAGSAGRRLTPVMRRRVTVAGRLAVLAIAIHLLIGA